MTSATTTWTELPGGCDGDGDVIAPGCTVVIPARNEAGSIAAVVQAVPPHLGAEVVVVDNGSDDGTAEVARRAGARVVTEPERGYGQACRTGLAAARATRVIVFIDGDGSMDPREIPGLVAPILAGTADIVCGSRRRRAEAGALPAHQRWGNWLAVVLLRLLYGVRLSDLGPFRAVDAGLLRELGLPGSRYAWVADLLARARLRGARVIEVDVAYRTRSAGRSKVSGTLRGTVGAGSALLGTLLWRRVTADPRRTVAWGAGVAAGIVALVPIWTFGWVALHRVGYPYELQYMEGGAVELVARAAAGHQLYTAPALGYVPWPYPPLFFWVAAGLTKVVGPGFLAPRIVSVLSTAGTFVLLGVMAARETARWSAGLVAAGLYAASYRISGAWFDLARVDSLALMLGLAAIWAGRRATSWKGGCGVGVLVFLGFLTKQTDLLVVAGALAFLVVRRPRVGLGAVATAGLLIGASTAALDASSGGWYGYYVFSELRGQGVVGQEWSSFWRLDIWHTSHLLLLAAGLGMVLVSTGWVGRTSRHGAAYYAAAAVGLLVAAWAGRLHDGGYDNVLMPAFAALGLLGGLAWGWGLSFFSAPTPAGRGRAGWLRRTAAWTLPAAVAWSLWAQLPSFSYRAASQVPTTADARAGAALLSALRRLPGPVIVLDHPWYATEVGQETTAQAEAIRDILRAGPGRARSDLLAGLRHDLPAAGSVILDDTGDEIGIRGVLAADFHQVALPWHPGRAFYPLTDLALRPGLLFERDRP